MIPPLVALLATADQPDRLSLARAAIQRLSARIQEDPRCHDRAPAVPLPKLSIRRLVPDKPGPELEAVAELLRSLSPDRLVPELRSRLDGQCVLAGLFLIHDHIDEAHELAQAADEIGRNTTAAYWHGIVHRREPDYDNARYWFRRVGMHPLFEPIGREVTESLRESSAEHPIRADDVLDHSGRWDPRAFIDLCQACGRSWSDRARAAEVLQEIELRRLLEYTCAASQGRSV